MQKKTYNIPIYFDGLINVVGSRERGEWKLLRWCVPDQSEIETSTIIAELECDKATIEHEVFYTGTIHHELNEGENFTTATPIAVLTCTEDEYQAYLQNERARSISFTLDSTEIEEIERYKSQKTNDEFAKKVFREGLKQIRHNKAG